MIISSTIFPHFPQTGANGCAHPHESWWSWVFIWWCHAPPLWVTPKQPHPAQVMWQMLNRRPITRPRPAHLSLPGLPPACVLTKRSEGDFTGCPPAWPTLAQQAAVVLLIHRAKLVWAARRRRGWNTVIATHQLTAFRCSVLVTLCAIKLNLI